MTVGRHGGCLLGAPSMGSEGIKALDMIANITVIFWTIVELE